MTEPLPPSPDPLPPARLAERWPAEGFMLGLVALLLALVGGQGLGGAMPLSPEAPRAAASDGAEAGRALAVATAPTESRREVPPTPPSSPAPALLAGGHSLAPALPAATPWPAAPDLVPRPVRNGPRQPTGPPSPSHA